MSKPHASPEHAASVRTYLEAQGLSHLRARKYGQLVIIESGPEADPIAHARLRRDTVHLWTLQFATHTGRWEKTGFRGLWQELLKLLTTAFPWTLPPLE
ncbi:hypothetical protein WME97_11425 [Sorangium sp. So ce367]|uniref:hypothetical protein n=1 Tax=Sorangium sp. So ce367 TaxID=3133305 RepID=UPI003F5D8730